MREQNGVQIFENDEEVPTPNGLRKDFALYSRFGFKIVEVNRRPMWAAATEEDYRNTVAQLLGIKPDEVRVDKDDKDEGIGCANVSPTRCRGGCGGAPLRCTLVFSPAFGAFVCVCL